MMDMANFAYISRKQRDFMAILKCIIYIFSVIKKNLEYYTYCTYQHNTKFRKVKWSGSTFQPEKVNVMLTWSSFSFHYGLISKCNSGKTPVRERPALMGCDLVHCLLPCGDPFK